MEYCFTLLRHPLSCSFPFLAGFTIWVMKSGIGCMNPINSDGYIPRHLSSLSHTHKKVPADFCKVRERYSWASFRVEAFVVVLPQRARRRGCLWGWPFIGSGAADPLPWDSPQSPPLMVFPRLCPSLLLCTCFLPCFLPLAFSLIVFSSRSI